MEAIPRHRFKDLNNLPLTIELGSYSSEMLYWGFFEPIYWRNYRHVHSFFEVCYAYQGQGQFRIGSETIDVSGGDLFIARPNEPHDIISSNTDPLGIYFWAYTLIPTMGVSSQDNPESELLHALLASFIQSDRQRVGTNATVRQTINLLTEEIARQEAGYTLTIRGLATNLLVETARLGCETDNHIAVDERMHTAAAETSAIVLQIKRYLQDNYVRPIRLTEIAAQVHLSERHICRIFSNETGQSIQKCLSEIRINVAKQMLLDQTTLVTEVAKATGFSDARYFSTFFRRSTGDTPTEFRQKRGTAFLESQN